MMKKILVLIATISMLLFVGNAWAVSITYTADNVANTWYLQGEEGSVRNFDAGTNGGNWKIADTEVFDDLAPSSSFTFVWHVSNDGNYSPNNPAAFLAQIDLGNGGMVVTDKNWSYSANFLNTTNNTTNFDLDGWDWQNVTEYGNNGGSNIWTRVNGGNAVSGISTDAQWIWSDYKLFTHENLFIRVDVRTAPVPEPGTLLLLGTGLAGLALYRRRSMNK